MSVEKIFKTAKEGNIESMVKYARIHLTGCGVDKDIDIAKKWFQKAADQGSAEAKTYLAYMHLKGLGVEKDISYAVDLYREAALKEDPVACFSLGLIYKNGLYNESKDLEHAILLFEKAAKANIIDAKYEIGMIKEIQYLEALTSAKDMMSKMKASALSTQAESALKEASDKGCIPAKFSLAMKYLNGQDNLKKPNALKLLEDYSQYNPVAFYVIGCMYDLGAGVKKDYCKSFEYYKKAYDLGYEMAVLNLAYAYITGAGVERNYKRAIDICRIAVNKGIKAANYYAGLCFKNGYGVPKNIEKAEELFIYASNAEYPYAFYELGVLNDSYYGFGKDDESAIEYYNKAAQFNVVNAKAELARITFKNDKKKGFEMMKQAAEDSSYIANEFLAKLYETGDGVKVDNNKALEYYKKAADCGSTIAPKAIINLADKTNNQIVKKQYQDKALVDSNFETACNIAKECQTSKDFERAAYYYALATIKATSEKDAEEMYEILNRYQKSNVSGAWSME